MKLRGNPWATGINGHDGIHARSLLCHLFQAFASRNWKPLTSADVSAKYVHQENGPDYPIDVHSIFFIYDAAVPQPSAPSFQATGYPASAFPATGYPAPAFQATGYPAPPLQTGGYPNPQYGFAQSFSPPPPYEPPAYGTK